MSALLVITALAAGLRLDQLGTRSLWIDELFTIADTGPAVRGEHHLTKTLGYLPTAAGLAISGTDFQSLDRDSVETWSSHGVSILAARLPSALIGILTVPIAALVSVPLLGRRGALLLAALLAVSTWHVWMSQVARFYSPQLLGALLSVLWYARWLKGDRLRCLVASMAALAFAFLSQPTAAFIGIAYAVAWILDMRSPRRDPRWRQTLTAGAVTAGVCGGLFAVDFIRDSADWTVMLGTLSLQTPTTVASGVVWMTGPPLIVAALGGLAAWIGHRSSGRDVTADRRAAIAVAAVAVIVPVAATILAISSVSHIRYAFPALGAWLVLAAFGLDRIWTRIAAGTSSEPAVGFHWGRSLLAASPAGVVLVASLVPTMTYATAGAGFRASWREAYALVDAGRVEGEAVIGSDQAALLGRFYLDEVVPNVPTWEAWAEQSFDRPTWIVLETRSPSIARGLPPILRAAEFRAVFRTQVHEPFHEVMVFRHPGPASPAVAAAPPGRPTLPRAEPPPP